MNPLTDVKHRRTGATATVALDLGDNVSVWVDGHAEDETEMWPREDVEIVEEHEGRHRLQGE